MDLLRYVELGAVAAVAAILGSMLGLGGGVFLVPILTLFFGVDQKVAIGASAVAVVTNSVVGSSVHLRSRFTNLRLAMLLQVTTAAGAIAGALFGVAADPAIVFGVFGAVLVYAAEGLLLGDPRVTGSAVRASLAGTVTYSVLLTPLVVPVVGALLRRLDVDPLGW